MTTHVKGRRAMFRLISLTGSMRTCQKAACAHERAAFAGGGVRAAARGGGGGAECAAAALAAAEAAIAALDP